MVHLNRQFVAALLAIWLPFFSGNSLAASVAMQSTRGDCHPASAQVAMQADEHHMHHDSAVHQHGQFVDGTDQVADQVEQQSSSCKDCGVCHFACSGFLATVVADIIKSHQSAQTYDTSSTQFQSFNSAPLDPPPLFRV